MAELPPKFNDERNFKPFAVENMLMEALVKAVELGAKQEERADEADEGRLDAEMTADQMAQKAEHDPLTGLHNRWVLEDTFLGLQSESNDYRALPENERRELYDTHAVLILDIDHFKQTNDSFGHKKGDEVLKNFSSLLIDNTRGEDFRVRMGGEEFAILLRNTDHEGAWKVAENIRNAFEESGEGTVSIGLTDVRQSDDLEEVLHRADMAMYEAKRLGRNRTVGHDELLHSEPTQ